MSSNNVGLFGDTTLTKVFVGGLAWETPKEAMRDHFEKFGEIFEAVIISDKLTGRSKGYGFVTFKDAESAKKACEDSSPIINGRRANCNLASLGARRVKSTSSATSPPQLPQPPQPGSNVGGPRSTSAASTNHVQWYYPAGTHPSPYHHQAVPYYGYSPSPTYIATDITYNHKMGYMNGQFPQMYPGQGVMGGNGMMTMYPVYHYHHQSHAAAMGMPAHIFPPTTTGPFPTVQPTSIMSKPGSVGPNPGTIGGRERGRGGCK